MDFTSDFKDKVAIVTGAGHGIGRATAMGFAAAGAKVVLAGYQDESINNVEAEIKKSGGEAIAVRADVGKSAEVDNMIKKTIDTYGNIDILVNNAGTDKMNEKGSFDFSFTDMSDEDWHRVMWVNLIGQFYCVRGAVPYMKRQKWGRIVNISSSVAYNAFIGSIGYLTSKAGIFILTQALARELGPYNIAVNCVAPGMVMSNWHKNATPEMIEGVRSILAMGKICVPEDVAHVIKFFCTSPMMATGQIVVVDGGHTMPM